MRRHKQEKNSTRTEEEEKKFFWSCGRQNKEMVNKGKEEREQKLD